MTRNLRFAAAILGVAVLIAFAGLHGMHQRIQRLSEAPTSEEEARREVLAPPISTPSDVKEQAKIFWAAGEDNIAPVQVELPLSADPAQRAKQVLEELISSPPTPEQRTLPADVTILGLYVLPDGTAIVDFSDALVTQIPSGISSETMIIDSIARTLDTNVSSLHRLKILIHGQEVETLAGHVDLTGFFDLNPASSQEPAPAQHTAAPPTLN
jgi:spore germination protein GerM